MNKIVVVMQARTTSSRLPCKALLPLGGLPSVVLAAKRAANKGGEVVVATSIDPSDDILEDILVQNSIKCIRGPLDNVLERLAIAVEVYDDDDWLVRLTGDNSFPDGKFIQELCESVILSGRDYMGTNYPKDGLPYGMSAEVVKIGSLRERIYVADKYEKEHVTPYIKEKSKGISFVPSISLNSEGMRCTLDTLDDYLRLHEIYKEVSNPLEISWHELCGILANLPENQPQNHCNPVGAKMTVGTVQLGVENYGRSNATGKPSEDVAKTLIHTALHRRIREFDTARAYGDSESRLAQILGNRLQEKCEVYTKLSPLSKLSETANEQQVRTAVEASIYKSCFKLKTRQLHTLLLHRWDHYSAYEGAIWKRLLEFKKEGLIKRLGVSISTPDELIQALKVDEIEKIQLPMNILDHRWYEPSVLSALCERPEVEIEVRSVYLQGILLNEKSVWPCREGFDPAPIIVKIEELVLAMKLESKADLCLSYIRSIPWVDRIVVGMETVEQLDLNAKLFSNSLLSEADLNTVRATLGEAPDWLLNPSTWNQ